MLIARLDCTCCVGICLISANVKIIDKIALQCIADHLGSVIEKEQAGFRSRSSCVIHINTPRIIVGQCAELRLLHLFFIDFEKTLGNVNRESIWNALFRLGISEKLKALIRATYGSTEYHDLNLEAI